MMGKHRQYQMIGIYLADGVQHDFDGGIVNISPDGRVVGRNLLDDRGQFDIYGVIVHLAKKLVLCFLKIYSQIPDMPTYYYQVAKEDDSADSTWKGNWTSSVSDKAAKLIKEAVMHFNNSKLQELGCMLLCRNQNGRCYLEEIEEKMRRKTSERYGQPISVEIILTPNDFEIENQDGGD
jgi:hypothetical protein